MPLEYDLNQLGWYNFERLVQGLLKDLFGAGVSAFGGTKDEGRDAWLSNSQAPFPTKVNGWSGDWLFQVKFCDSTTLGDQVSRRQLVKSFKSEISATLNRRQEAPNNYILVTNTLVNVGTDKKLRSIVDYCGFEGNFHVIGGKDVCDYLRANPNFRRSFPQLLGLADIELVVDKTIHARSRAYLDRYQKSLGKFVRTGAYESALEAIKKHNFVVLDGPPEVGKSFICAALAILFSTNGYEIVEIRSSNDFWQRHDPHSKQLFVADDALGTISLEHDLRADWERSLATVLSRLNPDHIMIWTARRYILEAALATSKLGTVGKGFPQLNEIVVDAQNLSAQERAEILYNHARQPGIPVHVRLLITQRMATVLFLRMKNT